MAKYSFRVYMWLNAVFERTCGKIQSLSVHVAKYSL